MEIFYVLTKYVQSRLLQNCRMRERFKSKSMNVSVRPPVSIDAYIQPFPTFDNSAADDIKKMSAKYERSLLMWILIIENSCKRKEFSYSRLLQRSHKTPLCGKVFNPFPHIDAFWRLWGRRLFEKQSDKRRNCSKRAISPFATMFSTFIHRLSIQL